ncbi:MAG: DHA2 family efflux MFS transporter permease subunit [bacterium]|nr:DHA2 family efflux MFS transporter permease subunit [bacterium]
MDELRPAQKWWIALAVVPAGLVQAVDATSVSIAIPNMMTSLRADLDQIQWVVTISLLMQTLLMPTAGWLSGRFGRRRLFIGGLLFVMVATLLCSLSWSLQSLIFFRAILGLGAGVLQPVTMTILFNAFPPEQRGTAMGVFNMSIALGLIIGRFGGYLVDAFDWRMIFFLTLPFSLSSAALGYVMLPRDEPQQHHSGVDIWGILTMGGFLIPLMIALSRGRFEGWDAAMIRGLFGLSALSLAAFVTIELRISNPLVELRLFRNFNFAMGSLVQLMVSILFSSSTFLLNIFLQRVYQFTPTQVGVLMFPQGIVYGIGSLAAGRLSDYMNPRLPLLIGLLCFAVVYFWLGGISPVATGAALMAMLCLRSFSFSCVNSPNTLMTLQALPADKVAMGTGLFSMSRGIAGTLGVALTTSFLEHQRATHAIALAQQQGFIALPSQWALTQLHNMFLGVGDHASLVQVKALAQLYGMMLAEATVTAYQDIFMLSGFLSLLNLLPALLRRRHVKQDVATTPAASSATEIGRNPSTR